MIVLYNQITGLSWKKWRYCKLGLGKPMQWKIIEQIAEFESEDGWLDKKLGSGFADSFELEQLSNWS